MPYEQADAIGCLKAEPCNGSLMSTDCLRATKAGVRVVPRGSIRAH